MYREFHTISESTYLSHCIHPSTHLCAVNAVVFGRASRADEGKLDIGADVRTFMAVSLSADEIGDRPHWSFPV